MAGLVFPASGRADSTKQALLTSGSAGSAACPTGLNSQRANRPVGPTVSSRGRQPTVCGARTGRAPARRQTRGASRLISVALPGLYSLATATLRGLAPPATDCRRVAALRRRGKALLVRGCSPEAPSAVGAIEGLDASRACLETPPDLTHVQQARRLRGGSESRPGPRDWSRATPPPVSIQRAGARPSVIHGASKRVSAHLLPRVGCPGTACDATTRYKSRLASVDRKASVGGAGRAATARYCRRRRSGILPRRTALHTPDTCQYVPAPGDHSHTLGT
jgi:hypothetical protein